MGVAFLCKPTTSQIPIEIGLQIAAKSIISLCCNLLCGSNSLETLKHPFGSFGMVQPQDIKGPTLEQPLCNLRVTLEQPLGNLWATSSNLKQPRINFGVTSRQTWATSGQVQGSFVANSGQPKGKP